MSIIAGSTARGFPYPGHAGSADGPTAFKALADAVEAAFDDPSGLTLGGPLTVPSYAAVDGAAGAEIDLRHTAAASGKKRSQLINVGGVTKLTHPNDANSAITNTGLVYDHATGVVDFPNGVATSAVVTSLPSSPTDGQEVNYLADGTNGIIWKFRYRAAAPGSYKWEFIGGSSLAAKVDTQESTTSDTYAAITTAGPSITAPLAGDYDVTISAEAFNDTEDGYSMMSFAIGGTAAADADRIVVGDPVFVTSTISRTVRKSGLVAAVSLASRYRRGGGVGTANFLRRGMLLTPVRVG